MPLLVLFSNIEDSLHAQINDEVRTPFKEICVCSDLVDGLLSLSSTVLIEKDAST